MSAPLKPWKGRYRRRLGDLVEAPDFLQAEGLPTGEHQLADLDLEHAARR